jgi:arylsulfatase A-like enzyme
VDVVRTIAEIGGAEVPRDWNGDSMVLWLDNPQTRWKDRAVSEYYTHNIASGCAMIRMGRFKYVYHTPADAAHPAQRELYDLEAALADSLPIRQRQPPPPIGSRAGSARG